MQTYSLVRIAASAVSLALGGLALTPAPAQASDLATVSASGTVLKADGSPCTSGGAAVQLMMDGGDGSHAPSGWTTSLRSDGTFTVVVSNAAAGDAVYVAVSCDDEGAIKYAYSFGHGRGLPDLGSAAVHTLSAGANVFTLGSLSVGEAAALVVRGTLLDSSGNPCEVGNAEVYEYEAAFSGWRNVTNPYHGHIDEGDGGSFRIDFSPDDYYGVAKNAPITVLANCVADDVDFWFGGSTAEPGAPTDANSRPALDGTTVDFGTLIFGRAPAPLATTAPAMIGGVKVGSTLTADPGQWNRAGLSFAYAWTVDGVVRSTATSYVVQPSDAGRQLVLVVTASSAQYATATASSAAVTVPLVATPVAPEDTRLTAKLTAVFGKLKAKKAGKVTVTVTSAKKKPTGRVVMKEGAITLGTATLMSSSKGKATIRLKALKKGAHTLVIAYAGDSSVQAASRTVRVKVR